MTTVLPNVTRLSDRVIRILGLNPGFYTLQGTNTYLIGKGPRRILLDTGEEKKPEYARLLASVLEEQKASIDSIVISHWHGDHIGGLLEVLNISGFKNAPLFKFQESSKDERFTKNTGLEFIYVKDNHELKVGDTTLRLLQTPGHTQDHMSLHLIEENAIFSGDCILGEGSTIFEDLWTYMQSLEKLKKINASHIYPGHGPMIRDAKAKIIEYISHRLKREEQLLSLLPIVEKDAKSADELFAQMYPDLPDQLKLGALRNISLHLQKLIKDKKIKEIQKKDEILFMKIV